MHIILKTNKTFCVRLICLISKYLSCTSNLTLYHSGKIVIIMEKNIHVIKTLKYQYITIITGINVSRDPRPNRCITTGA